MSSLIDYRPERDELLCFLADLEDALQGTDGLERFEDLRTRYGLDDKFNLPYYHRAYWHGPGMINFREYMVQQEEPIPNV